MIFMGLLYSSLKKHKNKEYPDYEDIHLTILHFILPAY